MHTPNHILAADMVIWLEDIRSNVDIAKAAVLLSERPGCEVDEYRKQTYRVYMPWRNCINI